MELLGGAVAGIHSMTDEHFGISVVEYMAAGAIPIGGRLIFIVQFFFFFFCFGLKISTEYLMGLLM